MIDSADFRIFKQFLEENLSQTDLDNRLLRDDVDLHRSQGKALNLRAILDVLDASVVKSVK